MLNLLKYMLATLLATGLTIREDAKNSSAPTERDGGATVPISEIIRVPEALDVDHVLEEQSRHFICIPLLRIFNLELRQPLSPGEHIALTGSHRRLGEWNVEKSIEMRSLDGGKRLEWLAKVPICANERISYRYFIYTLDGEGRKRIRLWEGQQHARVMESYQIYRKPGTDYFGETSGPAIDVGGRESPWLRYDRLIELKFIWRRQITLTTQRHAVRLKVDVLGGGSKQHDSIIEVSRYAYNRSEFRQQPEFGVRYSLDDGGKDIIIFRIMEPLRVRRSYKLIVYGLDRAEIGYAIIFNSDLRHSEGTLNLQLYSETLNLDMGRLLLPYLNVRPLAQAEELDMQGSFQHYWPLNWPAMHVGNRGVGKSFYDSTAPFIENTLSSFWHVHTLNGDMIELDVQLTKDYVPIVWHEDGFHTAPIGADVRSSYDLEYTLIRDIRYRELKRSRVFVIKSGAAKKRIIIEDYTHLNVQDINVMERIFPRLTEVFHQLPKSIGLIVDITWPQLLRHDSVVSSKATQHHTLDKNRYVDKIIATTALYGCGRPLIFASFDADICTMLRYKQNVYPTIFLTSGRTELWQRYKDLRTRSFVSAVNFAQSEFLLGTAPHVANFLDRRRPTQAIALGLDLLQVVFLWGEQLQNEFVLTNFERLHATGFIYDRIDLYNPHERRLKFFGAKELLEIFGRQCKSPLRNITSRVFTVQRKFLTIQIEY